MKEIKKIELMMALDRSQGKETILQHFENPKDLKFVIGSLEKLKHVLFDGFEGGYTWAPNLKRFKGKTVYCITFLLTKKDSIDPSIEFSTDHVENIEVEIKKKKYFGSSYDTLMSEAFIKATNDF